jgi:hypothetical protein
MSNRLSRDTEDAAKVLSALRDKYHPKEMLAEKLSAAEDLRAKLVNVVTGVRQWGVKAIEDDTLVSLNGAGSVLVQTDGETGQTYVTKSGGEPELVELEFDVINQEWVSRHLDDELVLNPGERHPRKPALVTLCAHIVRLLEPARG